MFQSIPNSIQQIVTCIFIAFIGGILLLVYSNRNYPRYTDGTPSGKIPVQSDGYRMRTHSNLSSKKTEHLFRNPCWFSGEPSGDNIRCLPYFYVVGFGKSGTSNLCRCLSYHQEIAPPFRKEIGYWDTHADVQQEYFDLLKSASREIFNSTSSVAGGQYFHHKVTYDCTPRNVWKLPGLPLSIYDSNPKTKLIFIMRHPTDRLYSRAHFAKVRVNKTFSHDLFLKDISSSMKEMQRCERSINKMTCIPPWPKTKEYLKKSIYHVYIMEWMKVFPRNQMMFIKAEEFYNDTVSVMDEVFRFLNLSQVTSVGKELIAESRSSYEPPGARTKWLFEVSSMNGSGKSPTADALISEWSKYKDTMVPETRLLLDQFYKPYNKKLAELLHDRKFLFER